MKTKQHYEYKNYDHGHNMPHHPHNMEHSGNSLGIVGTTITVLINIFLLIRPDVLATWIGIFVGLLTAIYYIIKIYKELKNK